MRRGSAPHALGRIAAGLARRDPADRGEYIGMADDAARQHVGAIANTRAHAIHRRRGHADFLEVRQARYAGAVLAEAGVV